MLFKKINNSIACISYWGEQVGYHYNVIFLATPKDKSIWGYYAEFEDHTKRIALADVSDAELLGLWPHRTRERGFSQRSTENLLRQELADRGYSFSNGKWIK